MARRKKLKVSKKIRDMPTESTRIPGKVKRSYTVASPSNKPAPGPRSVRPSWMKQAVAPASKPRAISSLSILSLDSTGTLGDGEEMLVRRLEDAFSKLRGSKRKRSRTVDGCDIAEVWLLIWRSNMVGLPFTPTMIYRTEKIKGGRFVPGQLASIATLRRCVERMSKAGLLSQVMIADPDSWRGRKGTTTAYRIRLPSDPAVIEEEETSSDFGINFDALMAAGLAAEQDFKDLAKASKQLGEAFKKAGVVTGSPSRPPVAVARGYIALKKETDGEK